jgi:hypothetical protein
MGDSEVAVLARDPQDRLAAALASREICPRVKIIPDIAGSDRQTKERKEGSCVSSIRLKPTTKIAAAAEPRRVP